MPTRRPPYAARRLRLPLAALAAALGAAAGAAAAADFPVGPGRKYARLGDVPWHELLPGDTVLVHHRPEPYREKILVSSRGTPDRWIRVLGVPGPGGELPVISGDGATTSRNMRHRWQDASGSSAIQHLGVVQVAVRADGPVPGYIEIANLRIQDGYRTYRFTAENGVQASYDPFAACIYARSAQHLLIRDNVLANCGQGFYNWTGDGSAAAWWAALQVDTVLRGNRFVGNGHAGSYTEHQAYTESDGVVIERNHFGPQRAGALGSQIKDRSAGTVIRYNTIEQSAAGWDIDLVEPQESWRSLGSRPAYAQAFVYGNVIVNRTNPTPNVVHWNEDHQAGQGRATLDGGRLFFYANTVVHFSAPGESRPFTVFNGTWGGYECPPERPRGVIDVRNNIFAVIPRAPGAAAQRLRFGYCGTERFELGRNWVSPGWTLNGVAPGGTAALVSPAGNDPGFADPAAGDFRLSAGSTALGIGGPLAPEVTANRLGQDLSPTLQIAPDRRTVPRPRWGAGSDAGAHERVEP